MSKDRMNVQTIAEVLIEQLAKMETTAKRIENAANRPINVDTQELQQLLSHQDGILKRQAELFKEKLYTPRWVVKAVVFMVLFLALFAATAVGISIHFKNKYQTELQEAAYWYDKFQELEKTIPKKTK